MKKVTSILVLMGLVFLLSACKGTDSDPEKTTVKVMAPLGSPALAQTYMESKGLGLDNFAEFEIDIVSGTDPLIVAFGSESHDIIYAPTNLGAKLISTGVPYKFAGTVVWGNLYLATGSDDAFTLADLDGKEIIIFGQNATPDIIIQTILADQTYTTAPTITYVADAGTAMATLVTDPSKIVLLAEPVLSVASLPSKVANLKSIDLQVAWEDVTGSSSYPQAGIFVHKDLDKDIVDGYLELVDLSITEALADPAAVAQMAVDLDYGFPLPVLTSAIPRSNIDFVSASDSKAALELYFGYIIAFSDTSKNLIGGALPNDDFYYE